MQEYEKFIGRKVSVIEEEHSYKNITYPVIKLSSNDSTIQEIESAIKEAGFVSRVWLPGTVGTCDYKTSRVNVYVEKVTDGTYEVTKFKIG